RDRSGDRRRPAFGHHRPGRDGRRGANGGARCAARREKRAERMSRLVVQNARIVDPASGLDAMGSLEVDDGVIVSVSTGPAKRAPGGTTLLDAGGLVLPTGLREKRVYTCQTDHDGRQTSATPSEA